MNKRKSKPGIFFGLLFVRVYFCLSVFVHGTAVGDKPLEHLQQRNYTIKDGLPQNSILSIAQTPDGFIWVATNAGIARFDGLDFDVFNRDNTPGFTDDIVCCLLVDRKGALWFGTGNGGAMCFKNGRIEKIYTEKEGLLSNEVRFIRESRDGSIWFGTVNGLNHLYRGKISAFPFPGVTKRWIESLAEDPAGDICCGTTNGLLILTRRRNEYEWLEKGFEERQITTIAFDGDRNMWLGTNGNGIFRFRGDTVSPFSMKDGLTSNLIGIIFFDRGGIPWVGTRNSGLNHINGDRISVLNHENGLSHDYVSALFEDKEGNIWIGTNGGGLNILYDSRITTYNTKNGLSFDHVLGVFQDSRGCTWVGTFGGGINCIKDRKVIKQLTVKDGLPSDFIITIGEDREGNIWFGTYGSGLVRMDGKTNALKTYTMRDGLISDFVYGIYTDRRGHLWVGTNKGGLHLFSDGRFTLSRTLGGKVRAFLEDSRGNLWIGTDGFGLMRIKIRDDRGEKKWETEVFDVKSGLSNSDILAIFEDKTGVIWIATFGAGVNRYTYEEGVFKALRQKDGLLHDVIFWILEDNNDNFWMSSMRGIFRVSHRELDDFFSGKPGGSRMITGTVFDESSGMKVRECNGGSQPSGWLARDGQLLFITAVGLAAVDSSAAWVPPPPPPISIKKVIIDDKEYSPYKDPVAPPGKGNIEIHYAGLSFRVPEQIRFKYKLEGYDEEWIYSGTRREAYYTNIPYGTYRFRVKAGHHDGTWNETGIHLGITIKPHLLDIWWLKVLALLFVLFLVRLFFIFKMKRIKMQQQELERLVAERTHNLGDKTLELEKINSIVKSINTEVDPEDILVAILNETAILEGIDRAAALVYDKAHDAYTFKAAVGYEVNRPERLYFSYEETRDRYLNNSLEIVENIYIAENHCGQPGEEKLKPVGIPKSMLILEIRGGDSRDVPAGYLIFEDMNDENAFENQDVELLKNLKDHIASAFIKSKLLLELRAERVAAEAANCAKSMFLARMSHEIRTPMNSVIGFADMLMDTALNEEQREYSQNITQCGEALLHLIDDILDFSKIEAGQLNFQLLDFDPEVMAFDVCRLMQPRLVGKPVEILCRIGDNIPAFVRSDPARIRQVLVNLMGNAVKFTNEGEIELAMTIAEESPEQLKFHMTVRDTGIGIPAEQIDLIFEVFQQADGSITRKYGGTGLGLAISRQIAAHLKGRIWVESQPGRGSAFHFTAWLEKSRKEPVPAFSMQELENKKVLLVDDNLNNLDILFHLVRGARMRGVKVSDGKEVLSLLEEALQNSDPFDLCILDIQLPGISGCDVAGQIRAHPNPTVAKLPILGFSATAAKQTEIYRKTGFDGFLPRPIQKKKLLVMMKRLLGGDMAASGDKPQIRKREEENAVTQHSLTDEVKHAVHILLAEDNLLNQKLARFMLTKGGYKIEVVNNGKEAVAAYTANPEKFHLIFMDVNMPEMDGQEAARLIREKGFTTVPIIAMTAHALKEDQEKCLEAGMNDYISKPIKRDIVFNMVNKWVLKEP